MEAHGGLITLDDLEDYTVVERKPLSGTLPRLRDPHRAAAQFGGVGILQMLGMLEGTGYEKAGAGSAVADPLHDRGHAPLLRRPHRATSAIPISSRSRPAARPDVPRQAPRLHRPGARHPERPRRARRSSPATSPPRPRTTPIADAEGNVVAVTYTLNGGFGAASPPPASASCSTTRWTISPPSPATPTCTA